jgi:hypothetical protein
MGDYTISWWLINAFVVFARLSLNIKKLQKFIVVPSNVAPCL